MIAYLDIMEMESPVKVKTHDWKSTTIILSHSFEMDKVVLHNHYNHFWERQKSSDLFIIFFMNIMNKFIGSHMILNVYIYCISYVTFHMLCAIRRSLLVYSWVTEEVRVLFSLLFQESQKSRWWHRLYLSVALCCTHVWSAGTPKMIYNHKDLTLRVH